MVNASDELYVDGNTFQATSMVAKIAHFNKKTRKSDSNHDTMDKLEYHKRYGIV